MLNTDNAMASDMRPHLRHIYAGVYDEACVDGQWTQRRQASYASIIKTKHTGIWVEHVVKHPQYRIGQGSQLPPLFAEKLEDYITGLAVFR